MKTIDVTPTWTEILPVWIDIFRQAIEGNCTNPDIVIASCKNELRQMALAADRWNAYFRELNDEASIEEMERVNEKLNGIDPRPSTDTSK